MVLNAVKNKVKSAIIRDFTSTGYEMDRADTSVILTGPEHIITIDEDNDMLIISFL